MDKEDLKILYPHYSIRKIAKMFNVSKTTISRWMKKLDIKSNHIIRVKVIYNKFTKTKEWLYSEYVIKNKTRYDIAKENNFSPTVVRYWLEKWDIWRPRVMKEEQKNHRKIVMIGKNMGENSGRWKGGITPLRFKIYNSNKYKQWRKSVFERDNYTCQECGCKSIKGERHEFEAHHIVPFSGCIEMDYEDLICDIDNGMTLCVDCHKEKTFGGKNGSFN